MTKLLEFCERSGTKGNDAREFELAISWVLSMMGFRVMVFGNTNATQDGVDLVATTEKGDVLLVECTAGVIKGDKVAQLARRADAMRERLVASGRSSLRVIPLMCTNLKRSSAQAGIEMAEKLGILVACREDIDTQLQRTLMVPDADERFEEAVKAASDAKSRHTAPLPFE